MKEINGIEEARELPGIRQVSIVHGVGENVGEIKSSVDRVGFVIAQADNAMLAIADCVKALEKVKVDIR